jgi:hypothetical protein
MARTDKQKLSLAYDSLKPKLADEPHTSGAMTFGMFDVLEAGPYA